ncbi:hypothetical protein L5D93_18750 [Paenibacillus thiaminolyticus]|nr:hypothetical protein [Paenibacillus thiaminolyticus]
MKVSRLKVDGTHTSSIMEQRRAQVKDRRLHSNIVMPMEYGAGSRKKA